MLFRKYGKTDKMLSVLGFGGMRFKKQEYDKDPGICAELVKYANSRGINYFDTAPGYCEDMSEKIFKIAFRDMPGKFYVSTKSSNWADKTAADVINRCKTSIDRMGLDKINFFHMWCIMNLEHYKKVMAPGGPYEGALRLKEEGLVEHICISTHARGSEIEKIANEKHYEGILLGYNATNFAFRGRGLKAAADNGMGVVTMNPLGGGIIPQYPDHFSFIKRNPEDTLARAALRFNISHPEITVTLAGMESRKQVDDNVLAAENVEILTGDDIDYLKKNLDESMDGFCTGCNYCDKCPEKIPVAEFMDAYNSLIITSDKAQVVNRLKHHWGIKPKKASECNNCKKCERLCTQHIPITERLKEISGMV